MKHRMARMVIAGVFSFAIGTQLGTARVAAEFGQGCGSFWCLRKTGESGQTYYAHRGTEEGSGNWTTDHSHTAPGGYAQYHDYILEGSYMELVNPEVTHLNCD